MGGCTVMSFMDLARRVETRGLKRAGFALVAALGIVASPLAAQVETFDPDEAYASQQQQPASTGIDADLASPGASASQPKVPTPVDQWEPPEGTANTDTGFDEEFSDLEGQDNAATQADWAVDGTTPAVNAEVAPPVDGQGVPTEQAADSTTYGEDDLIGAAEGVFGKGAEGLAGLIEDLLRKQGEPNGYIVGREAGGAFIVGARYGSGTLHHKVEGERKVYWTGPSIGFDAGASAGSSFVLVYNLYDTQDLFKRFPAGEGQAYFIGGLHVSYLRRGDIVLIPIRVGAGLRLGVNAGYMKFSEKQRWLPF
jgi:hypothetical protein